MVPVSTEPDEFFAASQQRRLRELLDLRDALSSGEEMPTAQKCELADLITKELDGSARRAAATADKLGM
jgi:two-component sensor histidine kinase